MKTFVTKSFVAFSVMLLVGGTAVEQAQAGSNRPGFFERLFGVDRNEPYSTRNRNRSLFGWKNDPYYGDSQPRSTKKNKSRPVVSDADPEGDPGLGMGNLTYVPPKLVPLAAVKLPAERPADAAAAAIYDQLSTGDGAALRVLPAARDAIVGQYAAQGFRPVWLKDGKLSDRGAAVLKLLAAAGEEGLEPQSYLPTGLAAFDSPLPENDTAAMARLDIDLTGAAVRYARDASGGQFDPGLLSKYNDLSPPWVPADKALKVIAFSPFAADYLKGLNPTHPAYAAMKAALAEIRAAEAKPKDDKIADGDIVKRGQSDPRMPAIRNRLADLGYQVTQDAEDPELLDAELSVQLRLFQKSAGIRVTGAIGPQTVAALNSADVRGSVDKLLDNLERLRWMPRNLGERYVFVNQAAFEAQVIRDGKPEWTTRVIVGKPMTQTAVFNDEMEMVVFNPSWGVPPSIIANEYLPKLRRDPGYLDKLGFKVVNQNGKVVSSRSVRWGAYGSKVPFGIQQPPGEKNALGELKFLFPNSHDIYMHDTPSRELFEQNVRAFSHGCVRVQNPREFASVVLGWSPEEVAKKVDSKASETVRLKQKLPVHIAYFTAWPDEAGKITYFNDIYGRDKPIDNARSTTLVAQR